MATLIRLLICISIAGVGFYKYIDKLNELTGLQMLIPNLEKELKELQERNLELQYEIEQFKRPANLIELARRPEFGHLDYPTKDQIILIPVQHAN